MGERWSGGQYSVFRVLFGAYLAIHFLHLLPWSAELFSSAGMLPAAELSPLARLFPNVLAIYDAPWFVAALVAAATLASFGFMLGWRDKLCAVFIWYTLACLFGRNPLISNPSLPYAGWMLLAHLLTAPAPYGSWAARGRADPAGSWRLPRALFIAAWVVLAVSYSYSGYTKLLSPSWVAGDTIALVLHNPLARDWFARDILLWLPPICLQLLTWTVLYVELLFAPLALVPSLRKWLWLAMLLIQFGFLFLLNFADLTTAMLLFHLLTFDPAWIRPRRRAASGVLFYDGGCGLCHRVVRFLLAEDREGRFRFSPLQGEAFARLPSADKEGLPDSIVLRTADGETLLRSDAVVHLLQSLGGMWTALGSLLWLVPKPIRDLGYDGVGRIRARLFAAPTDLCPVVPVALRSRFFG